MTLVCDNQATLHIASNQSFKRRKRKARRFCVREARRKPRGFEA